MSDHPGDDEPTRPLGWNQPDPPRGWDHPPAGSDPQPAPRDSPYGSPQGSPYGNPPGTPPPPPQMQWQPGPYAPYGVPVVDHPRATLSMVLGIVGLVGGLSCGVGFLLSPVAWIVGRSTVREIRASGGHYGGEGPARAGEVLGIVGTVLLVLGLLVIAAFVVFVVLLGSGDTGYSNV